MVEILYKWINDEVKLSKRITNFSDDFYNGFYFGELLYKYKLLPQFNQFQNNAEKSTISKNFLILQHKFDELKINFNENDKKDIINKKKYKAEMLLFRIREKLLSKLLQIEEIEKRNKAPKELNKIYKNVTWGIDQKKRLQSAKPTNKEIINIDNKNEPTKNNRINNSNKISKKERLQSAKLPKLNKNFINLGKNKAYISGLESIAINTNINKKDNKLFKQTLKEIEIFENIHMRNKLDIENLERRKHEKEEQKEKDNLESWKKNYKKIRKLDEEKKIKDNQRMNRLKSATQKSFNKTQQNFLTHIDNFDKKLDHLGLNTKGEFIEIKKNEISNESYMKTIIDAVKEKEKMRRQYEIRMKKINGLKEIKEDNKESTNKDFLEEESKKRPQSSATTFKFYSHKNKEDNNNTDESNKFSQIKNRPFSAKTDIISSNINKNKNIRPKSGFYQNQINFNSDEQNKILSQIPENVPLINVNSQSYLNDYLTNEIFDENRFFEELDKERGDYFERKKDKRHKKILYNQKVIKNTINSLIDIVDLCFEYKKEHNKKLVEMEEWDKIISNFIQGNPIIIKKEKPKKKIEEDFDNTSYNIYNPIKDSDKKDFGQYEYDEFKNFLHLIGDKFDPEKNNLFVQKFKLGQDNVDINNIMNPEEIQILYEEAKKSRRIIIDEADEKSEYSNHNMMVRYIPSKEEEEMLEPIKDKYPSNFLFTSLITESIKFSYDKDPKTFMPKDTINSKVIEEEIIIPQQVDTENSQRKNIIIDNDKNGVSKISDDNKNENNNKTNSEEEKIVNMKELIESIPVRISFLGVQKTEKKTRAKNMEKKYNGLKVYHIKDFRKSLEENNSEINDENIIDLLIKKIREDFQYKNLDDIKNDIIKKREEIKNINNEIEKIKEEQEKKGKFNITKEIQNYQQQIEKINNESMIGFILIGIPENISQLKLIEKKIMNFTQPCEQSISTYDEIYEKLILICDQPQKDKIFEKNFILSLNKIIHFESNKEVLFNKIDNRKKDPVKGDIYQMDLFPPKDKKILARLEDIIHPTHEEIETEIIKDENDYELIENYYSNLDVKCVEFKGYIINENLNEMNFKNYMQALEQNALELDNQIEKELQEILNLYEDMLVGPVNEKDALLEDIDNLNMNESSNVGGNKDKKENDLSQIPEVSNHNNNNINNKNSPNQISKKDSFNSSMTFVKEISRINSNNNINLTQGELSVSQNNIFPSSSLSEVELFNTYQTWKKLSYFYANQYYKIFNKEKKTGQKYIERLKDIQKNFIEFLSRPSKKNEIIDQFLNKYIEFSKKCKVIENTKIVRERYLEDINELNETLWQTVEIRKNESLEKISNSSKLIDQELKVCYNTIEKMAILETQKFIETINILLRFFTKSKTYQVNNQNIQYYIFLVEDPSTEVLRKCDNCELATYDSKRNKYNYPKANQIYKNCLRILMKLYYYLNKNVFKFHEKMISNHQIKAKTTKKIKMKKNKKILSQQSTIKSNVLGNSKINEVQNKLKLAIKTEIDKYKYMSYYLYINSLETLSKIFCASKLVFKLMDNWIIDSMMYQNDAMSKLFNKLKSISVEDILQDSGVLDKENIYSNIELDDFSEKYKLFNYNEFLFDGQTDKNKFLTPKELNSKEFDVNIEKIMRLFTNWGCTNTNFDDIYGEMITVIRNGEIQNGIITKNTFEKIFFINKIIDNNNKNIFPDFFYNFDFHNIHLFLSHFITKFTDDKRKEIKNENNENEINTELNEEEEKEIKNSENKKNYQELIHSNEILTILFLICMEVISDVEANVIKAENEEKLINKKYMNKEDFINIKFWFEDKCSRLFKKDIDMSSKFKIFLFNINADKNGIINLVHFLDLVSLKSLKFENESEKKDIKYYFDLFYH